MIKRVILKNFQSWEHLDLNLTDINIFVGQSHSGKSAVMRALSCVLFNAMEGTGMVRHGAKEAEVTIEFGEHILTWKKGPSVNRYVLDGVVYDKPGRTVPPEIQSVLNIKTLSFGDEDVTLQWGKQIDAPFLLSASGAQATRMLSVAGEAVVVAKAGSLAKDVVRDKSSEINTYKKLVDETTDTLKKYEYLDDPSYLANVQLLRDIRKKLVELDTKKSWLVLARGNLANISTERVSLESRIAFLQNAHAQLTQLVEKLGLKEAIQEFKVTTDTLQVYRDSQPVAEQAVEVATHIKTLLEFKEKVVKTKLALQTIEQERSQLPTLHRAVDQAKDAYNALASQVCPTCGKPT